MAELFIFIIIIGIVILLVGPIIFAAERFGLGRRHRHRARSFTLYLPLATSLLVSLGLTLVLWLFSR
jgi:Protein of unknown function (DUF2905)